jgi:hypothetical protein
MKSLLIFCIYTLFVFTYSQEITCVVDHKIPEFCDRTRYPLSKALTATLDVVDGVAKVGYDAGLIVLPNKDKKSCQTAYKNLVCAKAFPRCTPKNASLAPCNLDHCYPFYRECYGYDSKTHCGPEKEPKVIILMHWLLLSVVVVGDWILVLA